MADKPTLDDWAAAAAKEVKGADLTWQHHGTHFWLVLAVAGVNVLVGSAMSRAAHVRGDGRLFLVSLVFLAAAGFLFAHALATPGVLIGHPNAGFDMAMTVGLIIGSVLAVLATSAKLASGPPGTSAKLASGPPGIDGRVAGATRWRLGLQLGYDDPVGHVALAEEAESLGFHSVWSSEAYGSDAVTPLAWIGARTRRLALGTAIMQMSARSPAATASR